MNRLLLPIVGVALAQQFQSDGYEYEYYDPVTGATLPPAGSPQPVGIQGIPQFNPASAAPMFAAPATYVAPVSNFAPSFAASSVVGSPVYSPYPVTAFPATTVLPPVSFSSSPVYGASSVVVNTGSAPLAGARVAAPGRPVQSSANIEAMRATAERQARQRRRNVRIVREASDDQRKVSLLDAVLSPGEGSTSWFPALRLGNQKRTADALKSEKRMAAQNARTAYQRYQENPTQLNLLVSKYSDLNADYKDASHHFNVVNSATFGQKVSSGLGGLGLLGGGGLTSFIVQKKERDELEDIKDRMRRVTRQIQGEVRAQTATKQGAGVVQGQGSVPQRMVAMSNYGPSAARRG